MCCLLGLCILVVVWLCMFGAGLCTWMSVCGCMPWCMAVLCIWAAALLGVCIQVLLADASVVSLHVYAVLVVEMCVCVCTFKFGLC